MAEDLPHTEQQMESLETNPLSYQADPNERFRWKCMDKNIYIFRMEHPNASKFES